MDKYIGRLLEDRYEILNVIGVGGMAVVYRAMDHRLNRLVAVKILKDDYLNDAEFRRRFHGESQAVAMMSHPNIVSVYDVSKNDEVDYIVMELIDGITLKQYMDQKGPLSWRETLHFSMQIAKALEHAHSRNIIHRDIKPHNVMILKDGSVKVADFGIARVASATNTLTKEALGSVHYISPEQAKGARVDARTDIYSLGVVMYEMLTGRPPYDGETPVSVAIQHINGTPLAPSLLNSEIPTGLEQITMHAMCSDLNIRYASVGDMLADMEEFRKDPTIRFTFLPVRAPAPVNPRSQPPVRPKTVQNQPREVEYEVSSEDRRRRILIGVSVALGVLALFVLILLLIKAVGAGKDSETKPTAPSQTASASTGATDESLPDYVAVPMFVGALYTDIPMEEEPYRYFTFDVTTEYNDAVEDGVIYGQSIPEGDMVRPGTEIRLQVSAGKSADLMPNLTRYEEERAKGRLEAMNLSLKILTEPENSDEIKKGFVIRTEPEAGTPLKEGQAVKVYVSLGKEQVEVPDFKNMDVGAAIQRINELELTYALEEDNSSEIAEGRVMGQRPEAGEGVDPGGKVTLIVSRGRKLVTMVNVVGQDLVFAKARLDSLGLLVTSTEEYNDAPVGQVIRQSASAGQQLAPGTTIALVVSAGPKPAPETEPPTETPAPPEPPIETPAPPEPTPETAAPPEPTPPPSSDPAPSTPLEPVPTESDVPAAAPSAPEEAG